MVYWRKKNIRHSSFHKQIPKNGAENIVGQPFYGISLMSSGDEQEIDLLDFVCGSINRKILFAFAKCNDSLKSFDLVSFEFIGPSDSANFNWISIAHYRLQLHRFYFQKVSKKPFHRPDIHQVNQNKLSCDGLVKCVHYVLQ